jgi:hypothetical protein
MATETTREARPDSRGRNTVTFPEEWGAPPRDLEERKRWIALNVRKGRELEQRGRRPEWLAPLERR